MHDRLGVPVAEGDAVLLPTSLVLNALQWTEGGMVQATLGKVTAGAYQCNSELDVVVHLKNILVAHVVKLPTEPAAPDAPKKD